MSLAQERPIGGPTKAHKQGLLSYQTKMRLLPLAYVAPLLPPQSRFYQIADIALPIMPDGEFDRRIRTALKNPLPGGAWELHTRGKPIRKPLLERYGMRVDASRACVEIEGAWLGTAIEACPLVAREK